MKKIFFLLFILVAAFFRMEAAPVISNFAYTTNTCSTTSKAFTVNISDAASIASGSLTPRVYYRKNLGSFISTTGTLTAGTLTNGVWTFNMTYTITGGDFIYFYVVAQNIPGNITAYPTAGFSATDVNTVITDANDPIGFYFGLLNGTYTVGNGGNFTRLTDAAVAYNSPCATMLGPVTFILTDTAYKPSTGEVFPIVFGNRWEASPSNSLLIIPATGTNVNITSDTNSTSVIKFLNARYFTFDGNNGTGNGITVRSSSTGTSSSTGIWLAGNPPTAQGCKKGSIKHTNIYGKPYVFYTHGIYIGDDNNTFLSGGANNDSLEISNNQILRCVFGIYAFGTNTISTFIDGLSINSNTIGPTSSTPTINTIYSTGVYIGNIKGLDISDNLIQNCSSGIDAWSTQTLSIANNTIKSLAFNSIIFNIPCGIRLNNISNGNIRKNLISDITNYNNFMGVRGININDGSSNMIENNMISDLKCKAANNYTTWPVGIYLDGAGLITIDNNNVNLSGTHTSPTGNLGSAAMLVTGPGSMSNYGIKIRNNILCNSYDHSNTTTDTCYAIYSTATASNFTVMNYNDYYVGGTGNNPILGWYQTNKLSSLSNIQSSFGGNTNSFNVAPIFVSPTDLHLVTSSNPALDNNGIPITGITTDIDNQTRSTTAPDIGADEFLNSSPCTTALYGNVTTTSFTACSGQTLALNFIGGGSGTGFTYQWQTSTTPSGPYTNVVGGTGATTTNYTTAPLSAGMYYYVLQKTCTSVSMTTISNEATVTINPTPTASASCSPTAVCSNKVVNFTGGTDVGTSFAWSGPPGPVANTLNWTLFSSTLSYSGVFTFTATLGNCYSTATTSLLVYPIKQPTISVAPSLTICLGSSATLSAVGCTSYTWNSSIVSSSIVASPTLSGTSYLATGTDTNGCIASSIKYIYLYPSPAVSASSDPICYGQSSTLTINGATTYTWNTGPTTQAITVTPSVTSTYTVSGTSTSGCTYFVVKTINVNPLPTINANSSTALLCSGQSATLTATGGTAYLWNPGNISGNAIVVTPTITSTYTVIGYDNNFCSQTVVITQSVSPCTGINENVFANASINIVPNPNNGNFVLLIDKEIERGELNIFNSLGQEVYKQSVYSITNEISFRNIAKGLYYFTVSSKNNLTYTGKFIID